MVDQGACMKVRRKDLVKAVKVRCRNTDQSTLSHMPLLYTPDPESPHISQLMRSFLLMSELFATKLECLISFEECLFGGVSGPWLCHVHNT